MTKEELEHKLSLIENKRAVLNKEEYDLKEAYLDEHAIFKERDKVNITHRDKTQVGFISGVELRYDNVIRYEAVKMKKDGTPSQHGIYVYHDSKIELWK